MNGLRFPFAGRVFCGTVRAGASGSSTVVLTGYWVPPTVTVPVMVTVTVPAL